MIGPVCELKHVKVEDLGVYLDSDRTQSLPLDYDFYMLTGHILNVIGKNGVGYWIKPFVGLGWYSVFCGLGSTHSLCSMLLCREILGQSSYAHTVLVLLNHLFFHICDKNNILVGLEVMVLLVILLLFHFPHKKPCHDTAPNLQCCTAHVLCSSHC